jgi:hypothetical protein
MPEHVGKDDSPTKDDKEKGSDKDEAGEIMRMRSKFDARHVSTAGKKYPYSTPPAPA